MGKKELWIETVHPGTGLLLVLKPFLCPHTTEGIPFFYLSLFTLWEILHFVIFYSFFATCYYIYYIYQVIFTISFNSIGAIWLEGLRNASNWLHRPAQDISKSSWFEIEIDSTDCLFSVGRMLELSLPQFCFLVWGRSRRNRIPGADFGAVSTHLLRFSSDDLCSYSQRRIWKTYNEPELWNTKILPDLALLLLIKRHVEQCGADENSWAGLEQSQGISHRSHSQTQK